MAANGRRAPQGGRSDDLSELDHTVDYVLRTTDGSLDDVDGSGEIVGEELDDQTTTGWWPSDHAGVVESIEIVS